MRIYRGPSSKDFVDGPPHEHVDTKDLSSESQPWTGTKRVRVEITKVPVERQAVAHLVFEEADILALHQGLIKGWQEKLQGLEVLNKEISSLREALKSIHSNTNFARLGNDGAVISEIKAIAESALKKKGNK
jgi:hypothetical protein